ncbi:MAG: hypothetical protein ACLTQI_07465 [Slackia sp.]
MRILGASAFHQGAYAQYRPRYAFARQNLCYKHYSKDIVNHFIACAKKTASRCFASLTL